MTALETALPIRSLVEETPQIIHGDAFDWLEKARPNSIHAVVTDPPYGLIEYTPREIEKLRSGRGGVWRIPPAFDNAVRKPLPRFTVLKDGDKERLEQFFDHLANLLMPVLVPGAHVFIATNPLVSHFVYLPFIRAGFEKRGEIVRVVQTLRGGDRPKNAHEEFDSVSVMPRLVGNLGDCSANRVKDVFKIISANGRPGG